VMRCSTRSSIASTSSMTHSKWHSLQWCEL
jgi:hypothetical protein